MRVCVSHLTSCRQPSCQLPPPPPAAESVKHAQGPPTPGRDLAPRCRSSPAQELGRGWQEHETGLLCAAPSHGGGSLVWVHQSLRKTEEEETRSSLLS